MRRLLAVTALTAFCCAPCFAQPQIDYSKLEIRTTDLGHNLYLLNWQGGDSLFLAGDDGVLLVDTAVPQLGDKIKAAIARVSPKPIKFVINTHAHADHFGGETVELIHVPSAHMDNDKLVYFKHANVIHASGTIGGEPASAQLLKASRDALVTIRARVQKLIDEGKDEAQTIAAKPTKDLDAQWVHQGNLSGDVITRMAWQSLKGI